MLNRCYISLLFVFFATKAVAQEHFSVADIPQALKVRANAVIRNQQWVVDMRSANDVVLRVKQVLTVFNSVGHERARLAILYDKSTQIKSVNGIIQDQDGNLIKKISLKDFSDESAVSSFSLFEDNRVKHFLPNVSQYPFTVIYDYELKLKQNLVIPDWVPNLYPDLSVEQSSYTLLYGRGEAVNIKEVNFDGKRLDEENDKQKKHTWEVHRLLARKKEPFSPPNERQQIRIKVAPEKFYYYGKKGNYTNWQDLGKWVYNDLLMERQKPTPQMIAQVNVLTADLSSDKEKVRVLYKHLQQKVRYVSVQIGIGGFQPMAADQVEQLGYGDCKALVNYMQSLLSVAGISSYYCVVNAGDIKRDMDASFASMNQGNHVILAVPLEQDIVWLECTSQQVPFGFLGSFTADRIVFACTEEGGKLLRTPGFAAEENLQKREGRFVLDKEGDVKGPLSTSFYGNQFDNRFAVLGLPSIEQEKQLKEIYHVDNIAFKNITYVQKEAHDLQLNERFNIEIRRYAPKSGKRIYLIPNLFNRRAAVPTTQERTMPLFLNSGYKDVDSLVFTFPKDYRVDLKPSNIELDTEFGSFTMRLYVEGNDLFFYRALILHEGQFAPEKYLAFAQFINAVYQADLGKVVFLEQL